MINKSATSTLIIFCSFLLFANAAIAQKMQVSAGDFKTIYLPAKETLLKATTSAKGNYQWKKIAGPTCKIVTPSGLTTKITNLVAGGVCSGNGKFGSGSARGRWKK